MADSNTLIKYIHKLKEELDKTLKLLGKCEIKNSTRTDESLFLIQTLNDNLVEFQSYIATTKIDNKKSICFKSHISVDESEEFLCISDDDDTDDMLDTTLSNVSSSSQKESSHKGNKLWSEIKSKVNLTFEKFDCRKIQYVVCIKPFCVKTFLKS